MSESPLFFYSEQIRRYLLQFTRIFSNFQVEYGRAQETLTQSSGHALIRVPIRYGDASRQAQTIMQQNSASNMPAAPLMTFYIAGLSYDRPRVQEPYYVSKINVRQRKYVPDALDPTRIPGTYETSQGNAFTIERPMPVPYKLTINLDIWTTNTNQKLQLFEQISPLFNPALEIQATDSYIDWTTITVLELVDTKFTSKTIPVGTEDPIDIMTFTFELPIWLSPPVKVKKLGVVERIIASIYDQSITDYNLMSRQLITPYGYQIYVDQANPNGPYYGRIQCLPYDQPAQNFKLTTELNDPANVSNNTQLFWKPLVNVYGELRNGISYILLVQPDESEVKCYVSYDPSDDRYLLITGIDNWPSDGPYPAPIPLPVPAPITYVDAVIDPLQSGPGAGLPAAAVGQTYLFTAGTGNPDYLNVDATHRPPIDPAGQPYAYAYAWASTDNRPLIADSGDIVQYQVTGGIGSWVVVFSPGIAAEYENWYVTNTVTAIQYRWTGTEWVKSVDGFYGQYPEMQNWHLVL